MSYKRKEAKTLKVGDIVQGNVARVKDLDAAWYQITNVDQQPKDTVIEAKVVRIVGGVKTQGREGVVKEKMNPRTVLIAYV